MNIVVLVLLRAWSILVRKFRVMSDTALGHRGALSQVRRSMAAAFRQTKCQLIVETGLPVCADCSTLTDHTLF